MNTRNIGAIILAGGRGKRMNSTSVNKVALSVADKPIILRTVELLESINISNIIVVVGFAKKSVKQALNDKDVIFVEQKKRLGTAHALSFGLGNIPAFLEQVLVLQGDDSIFYERELLTKLITTHVASKASCTFLTLEVDNPFGLGRVVRDSKKRIVGIVEEKDASESQKKIKEINPALYIFKVSFLNKFLKKIKKSDITGEYYLTRIIDIAVKNKKHIETVGGKAISWRGINTPQELQEAERLFASRM